MAIEGGAKKKKVRIRTTMWLETRDSLVLIKEMVDGVWRVGMYWTRVNRGEGKIGQKKKLRGNE